MYIFGVFLVARLYIVGVCIPYHYILRFLPIFLYIFIHFACFLLVNIFFEFFYFALYCGFSQFIPLYMGVLSQFSVLKCFEFV